MGMQELDCINEAKEEAIRVILNLMNSGSENEEARGTSARENAKLDEVGYELDCSIIEEESDLMCEDLREIADEQRQGLTGNSDELARPRAQGQQL